AEPVANGFRPTAVRTDVVSFDLDAPRTQATDVVTVAVARNDVPCRRRRPPDGEIGCTVVFDSDKVAHGLCPSGIGADEVSYKLVAAACEVKGIRARGGSR